MRCKSERPMVKHKKGLWSPDEDKKLTYYVMNYGHSCWTSVPINAGLQRNGKSCRLRWINYLRPGLKRGAFSLQEEETILTLHGLLGNKWSQISQHLPGRTDNEIKNYWHSHLKKRAANSEHLQDHYKLEFTNSNMASTSNFINNSCADMDELVPPVSRISSLPKLLFADWMSLDDFQHEEFGKSNDQPFDGPNYELNTTMHEWQSNEGSTKRSETQNSLNCGSNDDMFHTHMKIDHIFEFNDGDFNIDEFMYM